MLSESQLSSRARIGALALHAKHDTLKVSAPGRAAANASLEARFLAEIDALAAERGEQLTGSERERRLSYRWKQHYATLAFQSARARAARKGRRDA